MGKGSVNERNILCKRKVWLFLMYFLFSPMTARGQEYFPDPLELAPEKEIECSWSKSNSDELKDCLKRKEFFSKMSPEEKKAYNREVKIREIAPCFLQSFYRF